MMLCKVILTINLEHLHRELQLRSVLIRKTVVTLSSFFFSMFELLQSTEIFPLHAVNKNQHFEARV